MNIKKAICLLMIVNLLLPNKEGLLAMDHFSRKDSIENLPGQDLPVIPVPGKIVFQSNRDGNLSEIWLLEEGRIRKLLSGSKTEKDIPKEFPKPFADMLGGAFADLKQPKFSPDGTKILCVGRGQLNILNLQGQIIDKIKPNKYPYLAVWSPDGKGVYYKAEDKLLEGGGSDNIYRYNLLDRSEQKITDLVPLPGIREILSFAVLPDDKKIVFRMVGEKTYGISLWIVNTDGSDLKLLAKYAGDPAWLPDGSKLVYASGHDLDGKRVSEHMEIFVLDIDSGKASRVTNNLWEDRNPVFSPDGTKVVFKSARHHEIVHGSELFVINLDGTGEARLTPPQRNEQYPADSSKGWATDEYPDWHA